MKKSNVPHGSCCNGEIYRVRIQDGCFLGDQIRVASGFGSRLKGLLGTRDLPTGHGLFLVPCQSIHMFFMSIPLDVAFVDSAGFVVALVSRIRPWRMSRMYPLALGALELPAGTFESAGLKKGDRLVFLKE